MQAATKFVPVVIVNGREQVGMPTTWADAAAYAERARVAGFLATTREYRPGKVERRFSGQQHTAFGAL